MTPPISLFELFWIFFYIGLFTVGGGLVAITLMQQTLVTRGLISADTFFNMVAISQSTPGPVGVNMATYIGTHFYGPLGGIITTMGEIMPSIIIIIVISILFKKFMNKPVIQSAFSMLRPTTTGIVLVAAAQIFLLAIVNVPQSPSVLLTAEGWKNLINIPSFIFYLFGLFILFKTKLHPVLLVAMGAVFGILFL